MTVAVQNLDAAWNPTSQQFIEADTTFLLDPDGDTALGLVPGFGGLAPNRDSWGGPYATIVAGKFRKGVQATALDQFFGMPADGLLGATEFTVELWANAIGDWSALSNAGLMVIGSAGGSFQMLVSSSKIQANISHNQNPASTSTYTANAQLTITSGQYPASTWVSVAVTLKSGALTLYVNGVQKAQTTGVIPPAIWSASDYKAAFYIGGDGFIVSDLRISRKARALGGRAIVAPSSSLITVTSTPLGSTVQKLNGNLHGVVSGLGAEAPQLQGSGVQGSIGASAVYRTDKLLTATPIKSGGTDATHPTLGQSGSFSYDWQVVDRSLRYISETLGAEPYISIDGNVPATGGLVNPFTNVTLTTTGGSQVPDLSGVVNCTSVGSAPTSGQFSYSGNIYAYTGKGASSLTGVALVSGTPNLSIPTTSTINVGNLTAGWAYQQAYSAGPPNNAATYAVIVQDLVDHVLNGLSLTHPPQYWGLWNEPDGGGSFWETGGTAIADYVALYNAVAPAIKAISSSAKVGGPELAGVTQSWLSALIANCQTNSIPLDFVSCHHYGGSASEPAQLSAYVTAECAAVGLTPVPKLICGEWSWHIANVGAWPYFQPNWNGLIPSGYAQNGVTNFGRNDWGAGWVATMLTQMQQQGYVRSIFCDPGPKTGGSTSDFMFGENLGTVHAPYNVMRMWAKTIGNTVLTSSGSADPGIQWVASTDGSKTYVFVACLHFRKLQTYPLLVNVAGAGVSDGTPVTAYLVDDQHSNTTDAATPGGVLQSVSLPVVSGGNVSITLRPRAAALLVLG